MVLHSFNIFTIIISVTIIISHILCCSWSPPYKPENKIILDYTNLG